MNWEQRDNPWNASYYTPIAASRVMLCFRSRHLAKRGGDGIQSFLCNDFETTEPMSGVQLELKIFKQQVNGTGQHWRRWQKPYTCNSKRLCSRRAEGTQRGFLQAPGRRVIIAEQFDVGGEQVANGLKD